MPFPQYCYTKNKADIKNNTGFQQFKRHKTGVSTSIIYMAYSMVNFFRSLSDAMMASTDRT